MVRTVHGVVWSAGILIGASAGELRADATAAQQIVVKKAVELVPDEVAPLFREQLGQLEERCLEPDTVWAKDPDLRERVRWHYVALDLEAESKTKAARLDAASRFPHELNVARRLYARSDRQDGGRLPWTIEKLFDELVDAFETGSETRVIQAAGHLLHFAADAALPFNATADRDGTELGNLVLERLRPGDRYYESANPRRRFQDELVRRNRSRYDGLVTVSREDADRVANALDRSFVVLSEALATLDDVLAADQAVLLKLSAVDAASFGEAQEKYYDQLDERCGDLCIERLRAAAVFGGNLIAGAWSVAGKPTAKEIRGRRDTGRLADAKRKTDEPRDGKAAEKDRAKEKPKVEPAVGQEVVASRNSELYHRPDCRWAKKINPNNLVKYDTANAAEVEGKKPCTTCKPG